MVSDVAACLLTRCFVKSVFSTTYEVTLIEENVPYQRTVDLVEMVNETFRKPKDDEDRWWGTTGIPAAFADRYAYFDAKRATPAVLGKAMNNFRFIHRMVNSLSEYWLCEK